MKTKCEYCGKEFEVTDKDVRTDLVHMIAFCPNCDQEIFLKLYICDPEKNKNCRRTTCQDLCFCTWNPDYAKQPFKIIDSDEAYILYEKGLESHGKNERLADDSCGY